MTKFVVAAFACLLSSSAFWFLLASIGSMGIRMLNEIAHRPDDSSFLVDTLQFGWNTFGHYPIYWLIFPLPGVIVGRAVFKIKSPRPMRKRVSSVKKRSHDGW